MEIEFDPTPSLEQIEARVRDLCRSAELREPDRVVEFVELVDGDCVALWEEEMVALIVEVEREEL